MSKLKEIKEGLLNVFVRTTPLANEDDKDIEQELSRINNITNNKLIHNLENSLSNNTGSVKKSVKARDSVNIKSVKTDNKEKINENIKDDQR